MTDKMEPALNPEYPETTETCINSSLLISISCTVLMRLMEGGRLAARHGLGHRHQYPAAPGNHQQRQGSLVSDDEVVFLLEPTSRGRTSWLVCSMVHPFVVAAAAAAAC